MQTLPGHRTLLQWHTAWKGWPSAARALLGLPSSVQNSSTICPWGTKSHLSFLKQTDLRAAGHKREFLVGDSLGWSGPAPSGDVAEPQEPCPCLHWVRGSSRAQTLEEEKFKGSDKESRASLGWVGTGECPPTPSWMGKGKRTRFSQKAAPCLGSKLYPEMTLEDLAGGHKCI